MHGVYKDIKNYNPDKENKIFIVSDDMIADMTQNKKLNSIVLKILLIFIENVQLNHILFFC